MRRVAMVLTLALASCTFEWNGQAPPFPLTGDPPQLGSFPKLNGDAPVGAASLLLGPDNVPWAEFCEYWDKGSGDTTRGCLKLHLSRLSPPGEASQDEDWSGDQLALLGRGVVLIAHDDTQSGVRTLTLHRPGDPASADTTFMVPAGPARVASDFFGDVFSYVVESSTDGTFSVFRRDMKHTRSLPLPDGYTAMSIRGGGAFRFTTDGATLVTQGTSGHVIAYSTLTDDLVDLGDLPTNLVLYNDLDALLCGSLGGLVLVPLDGSPQRALGGGGTNTFASPIAIDYDTAYYPASGGLWAAAIDGSTPPALVAPGGVRFLDRTGSGLVAYSRDSPSRYANGAGDGWIGDRQLMERGIFAQFSGDASRLRWLEHAANLGDYGDLTTALVDGGAAETLALNAFDYGELADGRVVAVEDAALTGTFNRLVVIDEQAQTKRWVAPSTFDFLIEPNGTEMVVDIVSGASGYDILRVPAPPR